MEISIFAALQLVVTGGFAVAMLVATARVKQLQAEQQERLTAAMSSLEDRIDAKIDSRVSQIRTELGGVAGQVDRVHGQMTQLTIDVGVLQKTLKNGGQAK